MAKRPVRRPDLHPGARLDLFLFLHDLVLRAGDPSTDELGTRIGVSHQAVWKALTGPRVPSWRLVERLVTCLSESGSAGPVTHAARRLWTHAVAEEREVRLHTTDHGRRGSSGRSEPLTVPTQNDQRHDEGLASVDPTSQAGGRVHDERSGGGIDVKSVGTADGPSQGTEAPELQERTETSLAVGADPRGVKDVSGRLVALVEERNGSARHTASRQSAEVTEEATNDLDGIRTRSDFAAALTDLRRRARLTIRDLASRLDIPPATLGGYFSGNHLPSERERLTDILQVCGVTDTTEIKRWQAALNRVWPLAVPDSQLYGSGPWLLIYGSGADSKDIAVHLQEQCITRRVYVELFRIDEVHHARIVYFTGLIVVLPSVNQPEALHSFARLINDYRARRHEGLESILNGSCKWFNAGVVQVVGSRAIMRHPELNAALGHVSVRHYTDYSMPLDLFQPYTTRSLVLLRQLDEEPAVDVRDEGIDRLWLDVQTWGVSDIRDVPKLRKCIDDLRGYYENGRFGQLYRPIPGLDRNRLDIILDGPLDVISGTKKTWAENGARVCRHVLNKLKKTVPELTRPGNANGKDVQTQLRGLYRNLRIIEAYMR